MGFPWGGGGGDTHILTGAVMLVVPLRVFKAKYLHLYITHYVLGVPRLIEWHFI